MKDWPYFLSILMLGLLLSGFVTPVLDPISFEYVAISLLCVVPFAKAYPPLYEG